MLHCSVSYLWLPITYTATYLFVFFCRYLWPAQLVYLFFAMNIAKYFKSTNFRNELKENLLMDALPILVLLSPLHNSILIPMHLYLHKLLVEEDEHSLESYNFFGWCLFFNQVKTNQIFTPSNFRVCAQLNEKCFKNWHTLYGHM